MHLGAFQISPSIFEIRNGQAISLSVTFKPRLPLFYVRCFIYLFLGRLLNYNPGKIAIKLLSPSRWIQSLIPRHIRKFKIVN